MKISYNWLKEYIKIDLPTKELADLLTDIGLEVEGVEPFETIKGGLEGIVVGLVKEVTKHPDADKLSVTKVDVGRDEDLQIVCGAPNVAAGQKVPVAVVGATLYGADGESFKIKKAKLRGQLSHGMICAEDELGISDDHDGIMILDNSAAIGAGLNEIIAVEQDTIFEIGLTPNRADAFHHIGVARDVRAALNYRNGTDLELQLPDVSAFEVGSSSSVEVSVINTEAAPRYCGVAIEGLSIAASPAWLQNRLKAIGQRPINNVVDITNFIMHEYGQPLHAFDLALVNGNVTVKNLEQDSVFVTLDETERKLSDEDLMICNADHGMCIAGVFGGLHSGVKDSTTGIFLESAYFDPRSIRRSSTRHGLRTDAAAHFEKGIDPAITVAAMKRAAMLITEIAGGKVTSDVIDIQSKEFAPFEVSMQFSQLHKLAGEKIPKEDVRRILDQLEIKITGEDGDTIQLAVPQYRPDVLREADIIEEVMRIYGFNAIPIPKKLNASINIEEAKSSDVLYEKAAAYLVGNGFYEIMINSITREEYNPQSESQVRLMNNLNADLTVMRQSMLHPGLEPIRHNLNHSNKDCKFFEMGKQYAVDADGFEERTKLSLWMTGTISSANWLSPGKAVDYFYTKSIVDRIIALLGFSQTRSIDIDHATLSHGRAVLNGDQTLATFGQITTSELKKMDIGQDVFYAEFDWDVIMDSVAGNGVTFSGIPKFPGIRRDLALLVDNAVSFDSIEALGWKYGKKILRDIDLFDVYQDKKMDSSKKSYAISFIFRDDHKTLSDKEVDKIMKQLIEAFKSELDAVIR